MDKYIVLLPLNYNDGTAVPESEIQAAVAELYVLGNGYTVEGQVRGAYRMKSGRKQEDELIKVSVMIAREQEDELRQLVRQFCRRFDQESIWLERTNSEIDLVHPETPEGDDDD